MATKIRGIEGMKHGEVDFEIQRGARFVLYQYCISIIILTFRRPSDIYFLRRRQGRHASGSEFAARASRTSAGRVAYSAEELSPWSFANPSVPVK